jgi:hypothetical protein
MKDPTSKFQHTLPYAALRVSPALAALYTSRPQSYSHSDSCSKCGSYLLDGNATIRVVRLRRPKLPNARALRRTCHPCGCINELLIDLDNTPFNPPKHDDPSPSITQEPTPTPGSLPLPPTQTKPRLKKKTGLKDLLSLSREKEKEGQSRRNDGQVGLAAFLSNL